MTKRPVGRPRKVNQKPRRTIQVRVGEELFVQINRAAQAEDRLVGNWLRAFLIKHFEQTEQNNA